ncbi:polysaccharide biosynthesis tyrosine autokinase [Micromonospora sp. NPDC004704]
MNGGSSLRALRRSWWLVLVAVISGLGIAGVVTTREVPQYVTTTTFFVTTPGKGTTDVMQGSTFSRERIKSYVDLVRGDRLAGMVAGEHPMGLSVQQIQERITAQAVRDTVLLTVTITDVDQARSERLAHAVLGEFTALVETLEGSPGADSPAVKLEVIAGPTPVTVTSRPLRNLGLGLLAGLLVGLAAAMLRETLDKTVRTSGMLLETTGAPVLAVVPHQGSMARKPALLRGGSTPGAESFRQLRTNLRCVDPSVRILAVTSAIPGEGRSITAANLAVMVAETGSRVLLLEADLRRPRIANYLKLPGRTGLSDVLAGRIEVSDALQQWGKHPLWVLPCGATPSNPSELLGSGKMATLLESERWNFDLIVIDTPALLPLTDGAVVAQAADGVILVARANMTGQEEVRAASAALRTVHAQVVGCVLNDVGRRDVGLAYRYGVGVRIGVRSRAAGEVLPLPEAAQAPGQAPDRAGTWWQGTAPSDGRRPVEAGVKGAGDPGAEGPRTSAR